MGKSTVVYVVGLSVIIGITLMNVNQSTVDSLDTYATYFGRTMAHNIALAGANIGTNKILFSSTYSTAFADSFAGGYYSVQYDSTAPMQKTMLVRSFFNSGGDMIRDTIKAVFMYTMFSRYGWFTEKENNGYVSPSGANGPFYGASDYKITGDSVFGYAHTNGKFNLGGRPYFDKKVTATNAPTLMLVNGVKDPVYNEGYEWGRTIKRDTANLVTLKSIANTGTTLPPGVFNNNDVGLEFFGDGTVRVRIPYNTGALHDTTLPITSVAANRIIGVDGGDIHVKGTYKGQVTLAAFKGGGAFVNKGNIWVDGSIVASDNPYTNPNSLDMLGLVAERMSYITKDNTRNASSVLNVQAAIYCHSGEFTAEEFWNIGIHGRVNLFGSLTQNSAGSLGVFNSSGLIHGMYYSIRHDPRFLSSGPPSFPFSTKYRLVSWWEN